MTIRGAGDSHRVLVDTGAYYALADPRDRNHSRAEATVAHLVTERRHWFTTNFILAETHALALNRLGRAMAVRTLQRIDTGMVTIVRVSSSDERRAREILVQYDDKDFTLTDATSFAVMERLHITAAFTFDRRFAQYGFTVLGPDR